MADFKMPSELMAEANESVAHYDLQLDKLIEAYRLPGRPNDRTLVVASLTKAYLEQMEHGDCAALLAVAVERLGEQPEPIPDIAADMQDAVAAVHKEPFVAPVVTPEEPIERLDRNPHTKEKLARARERKEIGLYRHPPVDPITGEVSAAEDAIWMGQMRHCDVPPPHRKSSCVAIMHDHGWIDDGIKYENGLYGRTVCPGDLTISPDPA